MSELSEAQDVDVNYYEGSTMPTTLNPVEAAESIGMDVYDFDILVREQAAGRLELLASRIRHGNEASEGDVKPEDYARITAEVWRQVESAKVLTEHWTREASVE